MDKIPYGIIGAGNHALRAHAIPARDSSLELIALFDPSKESMKNFEESYGAPLQKFDAGSYASFFKSGIQAVFISSPDAYHLPQLRHSLDAGMHTLVEKPLAINTDQLTELKRLLDNADPEIIISSCHPRRFDPPFQWLKGFLRGCTDEDRYGNIISLDFDFSYHKPVNQWKHERGLLLDHANHEIDLVNYLFGHDSFQAYRLADSFDRYHVVGQREDGIAFNFKGTRRLEERNYLEYVTIRFDRAALHMDSHSGTGYVENHETGLVEQTSPTPITDHALRGKDVMLDFARAIKGKTAPYLTKEDLLVNNAFSVILTEQKEWAYEHPEHS